MKGILKPIGLGALVGLILILIQNIFKIDDAIFQDTVLIIFVLIIVGSILFNAIFVRKYQKRIHRQIALLEQGKQKEALLDMQAMLEDAQKKRMKNIVRVCRLNMTAALCDLKEYNKALGILNDLGKDKLRGNELFVYDLNLCACYFYLGRYEEGLDVYDRSYTVFQRFKDNPFYGGYVAVVTIWAMVALGDKDQARTMLANAKVRWDKERLYEDYRMLDSILYDK